MAPALRIPPAVASDLCWHQPTGRLQQLLPQRRQQTKSLMLEARRQIDR
jgi:hypothetical protein